METGLTERKLFNIREDWYFADLFFSLSELKLHKTLFDTTIWKKKQYVYICKLLVGSKDESRKKAKVLKQGKKVFPFCLFSKYHNIKLILIRFSPETHHNIFMFVLKSKKV